MNTSYASIVVAVSVLALWLLIAGEVSASRVLSGCFVAIAVTAWARLADL